MFCDREDVNIDLCGAYNLFTAKRFEESLRLAHRAEEEALRNDDPAKTATTRGFLAVAYNANGNLTEAAKYAELTSRHFMHGGNPGAHLEMSAYRASLLQRDSKPGAALKVLFEVADGLPGVLNLAREYDQKFLAGIVDSIFVLAVETGQQELSAHKLRAIAKLISFQGGEAPVANDVYLLAATLLRHQEGQKNTALSILQEGLISATTAEQSCRTRSDLALLAFELGLLNEARAELHRFSTECSSLQDPTRQYNALATYALLLQQEGAPADARGTFQRAFHAYAEVGMSSDVSAPQLRALQKTHAQVLFQAGVLEDNLGAPEEAERLYTKSARTAYECGALVSEVAALGALVGVHTNQGNRTKAVENLQVMRERALALQQPAELAAALFYVARLSLQLGLWSNVEGDLNRSLELYLDVGDRLATATVHQQLAGFAQQKGDNALALEQHLEALALFEALADTRGQVRSLLALGDLYLWIDDYPTAEEYYQMALSLSEQANYLGGRIRAGASLLLLGVTLGRENAAADYAPKLVELQKLVLAEEFGARQVKTGLRNPEAQDTVAAIMYLYRVDGQIGALWYDDLSIPQETLRRLVDTYESSPPHPEFVREHAVARFYLGYAYMRDGKFRRADASLRRAEELAEMMASPEGYRVRYLRGVVALQRGRIGEAAELFAESERMFERYADRQYAPSVLGALRERASLGYRVGVEAAMELYRRTEDPKHAEAAFIGHEKGASRLLLDIIARAAVDRWEYADPDLRNQLRAADEHLAALRYSLATARSDPTALPAIKAEILTCERQRDVLQAKIEASIPKHHAMAKPSIVSIPEVQAALPSKTALLEFALGDKQSYLWIITAQTYGVVSLPPALDIKNAVDSYLQTLRTPLFTRSDWETHEREGSHLHETLLQEARTLLTDVDHLVIVPDAWLHHLPVEALVVPENKPLEGTPQKLRYLIDDYSVSYAPSASVLVAMQQRPEHQPPSRPILIVANPAYSQSPSADGSRSGFTQLPYSKQEAASIANALNLALSDDVLLQGASATEQALRARNLSDYQVLHFATHGILGDEVTRAQQPGLALSTDALRPLDGLLDLSEILRLKLSADLVVLSACDTARGELKAGEGIVGLTRAFLQTGARSVIASLWAVNDQSTSLFMGNFYENLREGLTTEALRTTKLQVRSTRVHSPALGGEVSLASPYYWAPFILTGAAVERPIAAARTPQSGPQG